MTRTTYIPVLTVGGPPRWSRRPIFFAATLLLAILGPPVAVLAVPISPGDILVINQHDGLVLVNPTTGAQTLISSGGFFANPLGVALEPSGQAVIADPAVGVIRVDPNSGAQTLLSGRVDRFVLSGPRSVVVAPNGDILVVDEKGASGGGEVVRIDPLTGAQTLVSSGGNFVIAVDLVLTAGGGILVVDQNAFGGGGGIIKVDPVTGAQTPLSSGGSFIEPFSITISDTGDIFVTDPGAAAIFQIDPLTGVQTTIASVGGELRGIGVGADGDLLVVVRPNTLLRVNPVTGAQTVLSSDGFFADANEIAIVPVPEPSSFLLFGSVLAGAGSLAWRRRRQK